MGVDMVLVYKYFYAAASKLLGFSKSFSSDGEDLIISKIFSDKPFGVYIDIGAYSPIRHSNTFRLYFQGWRGILIEPTRGFKWWSILRSRDLFYNVGIDSKISGTDIANRKFYQYKNHPDNNTLSIDRVEEVANLHSREPDVVESLKFVNIQYILSNSKQFLEGCEIDLLSIDIEGSEFEVINEFFQLNCHPKVICVEELGNTCLSVTNTNIYKLLTHSESYTLIAKTLFSSIYVKRNYLEKTNSSYLKEFQFNE